MVNIKYLEKFEREIVLNEAINERKRAFELAKSQFVYPYKVLGSFAVVILSGLSAYRYKMLLHLIPAAIAIPYLACETDFCYGRRTERIKRRADFLYRKRLAESGPHILIDDVKQRFKDLEEGRALD
ncbi:unnamed protein product [Thelazia callipaeda]|uniref:PrgI family protein n=1 Tax=Thelazia callipaeda TaxID=103827 RepID=A0A0N5CJZ6_THECL|nr:unnamed protein product [Thelazia callipaeda]